MTECGFMCRIREVRKPGQCRCKSHMNDEEKSEKLTKAWKDTKFAPPKAVTVSKDPEAEPRITVVGYTID